METTNSGSSKERPTHLFGTDAPKEDPKDDQLDRAPFSEEIARALVNWQDKRTLVVSLCGEWGTGKTTICNFVKYYLRQADPDVLYVDFNPWEWSAQEKVFEGFFQQIGSLFGKTDHAKRTRQLLRRWRWLALTLKTANVVHEGLPKWIPATIGMLALFGATAGGILQNWWVATGTAVLASLAILVGVLQIPEALIRMLQENSSDITLDDLRSEIAAELEKLKKPVIVFVDDIDRLTNTEIALLFQLVKANVQLPNVVFFLTFQKSVVVKAIANLISEDGAKYLRKIIQIEWETPVPGGAQIRPLLLKGIETVLNDGNPKIKWDKQRWQSIFSSGIWPYFENLRDIQRFLGTFKFYFQLQLKNNVLEVNALDLFATEVLRIFDNHAYLAISQSADWTKDGDTAVTWRGVKALDESKERLNSIIEQPERTASKKAALKIIFANLFPHPYGLGGDKDGFLKDLRICHSQHFHKYFRGTLDARDAFASRWHDFLNAANDRTRAREVIEKAIREDALEEFLSHLYAARKDVTSTALASVVTALFDVGDQFPRRTVGIGLFDAEVTTYRFIHFRLLDETEASRTDLLKEALSTTSGFYLPINFIHYEDEASRKRHPEIARVTAATEVKWLEEFGLKLIRKRAADGTLLSNEKDDFAFFCWQNWAGPAEAKEWVANFAADPKKALLLLKCLTSRSGPGDGTEEPFLVTRIVEDIIDLEKLNSQIGLIPSGELTQDDQQYVLLLRTAISLKRAGKPYAEVHLRGCPTN
jgi:Cdc6-like AAA superfamily ATPase